MPTILITGGWGFLGSCAALRFHSLGWEVRVIDDLSGLGSLAHMRRLRGVVPQVWTWGDGRIYHDVSLFDQMKSCFITMSETPEVVLHLAAQTAVTKSLDDPFRDFEVNALGTLNVLEVVRKYCPETTLIYASTNKVYGDGLFRDPVSEEQPLDPTTPYGCSKAAADCYVRDCARLYGLKTVVLRMSCVYGEYQYGTEDQGWLAHFALQAARRLPITVFGDGDQERDVLHVDDWCRLVERCVKRIDAVKGLALNVGGGPENVLSLNQALAKIGKLAGAKPIVRYAPARPGDQKSYVSHIGRAKHRLDWRPEVGVDVGLGRLWDWAKSKATVDSV